MATANTKQVRNLSPPSLPTAPTEYAQRYQDQFGNVLRLFFTQVANNVNAPKPFGSFYDTTTQTNPVANAVNLMKFNSTYDSTNGLQYNVAKDTNKITVGETAVYNIQFSVQLDKTGGGSTQFYIWLRINGVDLAYSASKVVVSGPNDQKIAAWNWVIGMNAGDYFQLAWSSPDTTSILLAAPAAAPVPAIPSVIVTVTWVSNIII